MKKNIGIFKYDIFPYMVIHTIIDWDDNGDITVDLGYPNFSTFKASWLIAVFPYNKKVELEKEINEMKNTFKEESEKIKEKLLSSFYHRYPAVNNLPALEKSKL
jgi:hypothetical protein